MKTLKLFIMVIALSGCTTQPTPLGPMTYTTSGLVHTLSCHYPYKKFACQKEARRICNAIDDHRKTVTVGTGYSYNDDDRSIREGTWFVVVFACEKTSRSGS